MEDEASRDGRKIVASTYLEVDITKPSLTITACGTADFTLRIRRAVLKAISEEVVDFSEVEYRPHMVPLRPGLQSGYLRDQENTQKEAASIRCPQKTYIKSPLSKQYHASF
jgi:hypothetical protein